VLSHPGTCFPHWCRGCGELPCPLNIPVPGSVVGNHPAAVPQIAELFHCSMAAAVHIFDVSPGNPVQHFSPAPQVTYSRAFLGCFWHDA